MIKKTMLKYIKMSKIKQADQLRTACFESKSQQPSDV